MFAATAKASNFFHSVSAQVSQIEDKWLFNSLMDFFLAHEDAEVIFSMQVHPI